MTTISAQHQQHQQQQQQQQPLLRRRVSLAPTPPPPPASARTASSSSECDVTTTDADTEPDARLRGDQKQRRRRRRPRAAAAAEDAPPRTWAALLWPFSASSAPSPSPPTRKKKPIAKKTLVLDLDETLVHSTSMGSRHHDHIIEVLVDKHVCLYYVYKRPGVDVFLKKVAEWYKVVIFTASMSEYADPVIDWLDKDRSLISRRYFRQHCTMHENGHFTKDLSIVDPDLSNVVLIDNSAVSFAVHPENAIPIETWTHDVNDEALFELLPFLDALRFTDDVRSVLGLRI